MKRPSFWQGVAAAAVLTVASGILPIVLNPFLGGADAVKALVAALALGYLLFLLRGSRVRTGRVTVLLAWIGLTGAAWWLAPAPSLFALVQILLLWIVRSLYFHRRLLPALADGGLLVVGAFVANQAGSLLLAVWVFFLLQALFALIPRGASRPPLRHVHTGNDAFETARGRAEAALHQLMGR